MSALTENARQSLRHLSIDLETYSSVSIQKVGLYKYVQSPDFQILLFAWSLDGSPVEVIDLTKSEEIPSSLWQAMFDEKVVKHAYNAVFEWYCLSKLANLSREESCAWLSQWRCTRLHGLYCGYPASLGKTAIALGLPEDKQKDRNGKALIRYFCVPREPTAANGQRTRNLPEHAPERWDLFKEYCRQDVITEMAIEQKLSTLLTFTVPDDIQQQWLTDAIINSRGAALDLELINGALQIDAQNTSDLLTEAQELTGLSNPNSLTQLLPWLQKRGAALDNLQKQTIEDALKNPDLPADVRRILEIRQGVSKTSNKKFVAMKEAVCEDGRVRGLLQFYGANRSGRWSGQIIQPQNLPRTYLDKDLIPLARQLTKNADGNALKMLFGDAATTLSQLIRTAFIPSKGNLFVDADFSAIEARVIAWLSGEQWRLDVFNSHGKIYEASAAAMFGVPIESIAKGKENYGLRAKGKIAELALGYQGGTGALLTMGALRMGLEESELPAIVQRWRKANQKIVQLWHDVEDAALRTVKAGFSSRAGKCTFILANCKDGRRFLIIELPSKRRLYYVNPFLTINRFGQESLGYWGMNQTTKKWSKIETYGGKLVENITQAVARDCLALKIEYLEKAGFPIVFHVHDEVVIDVKKDRADLNAVVEIMRKPIPWAPELPLNADGWIGDYFTKE